MSITSTIKTSAFVWSNTLSLLSRTGKGLAATVLFATLLEAALALGVIYSVKHLVDTITAATATIGTHNSFTSAVFIQLGITGGCIMASVLATSLASLLRMKQGMIVSDFVDREIHDRATRVDLAFYESPAYYDSLQRAREAGSQRPSQVIANVITLLRSGVMLVGILVLLAGIEARMLPVLLITVVIALVVRVHFTRAMFRWRTQRSQMERRASYLDWMLTSDVYAKEFRVSDLGGFLGETYASIKRQVRNEQLRIELRRTWAELGVAAIGAIFFFGATAFLIQQALAGSLTIGQVVMFVLLFRRAEGSGTEMVSSISRLVDDQLYLGQLFGFLSVEPNLKSPDSPVALVRPVVEGLKLNNVSFRYAQSERFALQNINFEIRPKQIVALVGENGSGKTSLIKLMCRLYDPDQGQVTLNGQDIRTYDPIEYRKVFSVIFQDYAKYPERVRDNIRYGSIDLPDDLAAIQVAAEQAGAHDYIKSLPLGYETPLTKLFDHGEEISIGQWQRLALARAFFPASEFIILDEPTSAVDPKAEFELFDNFRERIGDRGALIISHRLSTIRMADYTYVLDKGEIKEQGTHEELMALNGHYASLFEKQAQYYR
ncbi:MAG: ABC transporter ATP-binding protein [Hyphomonadaceae bacterium]|nr:ABC transporter ATP-binding protein [Aquidulcibacter sp.]